MKEVLILNLFLILAVDAEILKFPENFKFGVGSSAYQTEGAWNVSGKGVSIWDTLMHTRSDLLADGITGDVADDAYHHVEEDVANLKWLGVDYYRFSISWPRLLPTGFANKINADGVRYYNKVINSLLAQNITPFVTIYHWDLPQTLQDLGGWPNVLLVDYFVDYARIVFKLFGDRVKHWVTFNEPPVFCQNGYGLGFQAPGIHSDGIGDYQCGRTVLIAHGNVYKMYRNEFYSQQKGEVGIAINADWYESATNSLEDQIAAERTRQMQIGWWLHPIYSENGDYPDIMKLTIAQNSYEEGYPRSRLIPFTQEEIDLIRGSADFYGLNHYSTKLISANTSSTNWTTPSNDKDIGVVYLSVPIQRFAQFHRVDIVPWGFRKLLNWIKNQYNNPVVYVTENGYSDEGQLQDVGRTNYYQEYLKEMVRAIQIDKCDVRKYTAWSFTDNIEWNSGYTIRYGLFYVNITTPERSRTPKESAYFYKNIIQNRTLEA